MLGSAIFGTLARALPKSTITSKTPVLNKFKCSATK